MSGDELAALEPPEPETPEAPAAPAEEAADTTAAPAAESLTDAEVATAIAIIVSSVGGIICARARVAPLAPEEIGQLTDAGVKVASLYDFRADPKVMAWLGLGLSVTAVAAPRIGEAKARKTMARRDGERRPDVPPPPDRSPVGDGSDYHGAGARTSFAQASAVVNDDAPGA